MTDRIDNLINDLRRRFAQAGKTVDETEGILSEALNEATDATLPATIADLLDRMPEHLDRLRVLEGDLDSHIRQYWGGALDLMSVVVSANAEMCDAFRIESVDHKDEWLWLALTGLYSRACRVALEVHHLLTGALPAGALARARTLHEIAVVARVLTKNDGKSGSEDLAERYILHALIMQHKDHLAYPGRVPAEFQESFETLSAARDGLVQRFGKGFKDDQGWANPLFPNRPDKRVYLSDIEQLVGLDGALRYYYKQMSHEVHADAVGTVNSRSDDSTYPLNGRTDVGFEDPAFMAMDSLMVVADATLLSRYGAKTNLLAIRALEELKMLAWDAFEDAETPG